MHDLAVFLRQGGHRLIERDGLLRDALAGQLLRQLLAFVRRRAQNVFAEICRHAQEPRLFVLVVLKRRGALKIAEHRLLQDVLGVLPAAEIGEGKVQNARAVFCKRLLDRFPVHFPSPQLEDTPAAAFCQDFTQARVETICVSTASETPVSKSKL